MRTDTSVTKFRVFQQAPSGARTPYLIAEVPNNVKAGEQAKTAVDMVSSLLHLVNKFPKTWRARAVRI